MNLGYLFAHCHIAYFLFACCVFFLSVIRVVFLVHHGYIDDKKIIQLTYTTGIR
jgi:hypothetical protein